MSKVSVYPALPTPAQDSPELQAAQELNERAQLAQGRLALGCCIFWLSDGGYLLTALPPMGDVRGSDTWMRIYTAEHFIQIQGEDLRLLAWAMKEQRVDDLRVTADTGEQDPASKWVITSITAHVREHE